MDLALAQTLNAAGVTAETVKFANGTELLMLPYGGRILGLFAAKNRENFFWINPALGRVRSARSFVSADCWQNLGGERTWIGPEYAFFFPNFPDLSGYRPPSVLDRTTFVTRLKAGIYELHAVYSLKCAAPRARIRVRVTRWLEGAPNPLRPPGGTPLGDSVLYAGYSARTTLTILASTAALPSGSIGLWSIAQLPHGGEMLVPVYGGARPTVFFGRVPRGDLQVRRSLIRYRMKSKGEHKIGVRSYATTGRLGYIRIAGPDRAELVIRNHLVNPSADYPDAPVSKLTEGGYVVQACSVNNPQLGRFSEMEHHAPALGGAKSHGEDIVQMWAYRGPPGQIAAIAEALLGVRGL